MSTGYRLETHPKYGFRWVKPTPAPEEITRFYAEEFYSGEYKRFNNSSIEVQRRDKAFNDGRREDIWIGMQEAFGAPLEGKSLLDVGCGYAQALSFFRERGMICAGFDPAPAAVAHARAEGLEVVEAGMDKIEAFPGRRFDVVTLFHVLEHLADPVGVLEEIKDRVLTPGGLIVIEVPNEFNAFQVTGKEVHDLPEWWIAPPAHLNYFCRDTLSSLLQGTGFRVRVTEASFPLEMFLLFGDDYVRNPATGAECHRRRVAFEQNLRARGRSTALRAFYRALAAENLGRTVVAVAVAS